MGLEDFSREWIGVLNWGDKFREKEVEGEARVPCVRAGEKVRVIILMDSLGDEIAREDWMNVDSMREAFYENFGLGEVRSIQDIGFIKEKEVTLKVMVKKSVGWKEKLVEFEERVMEEMGDVVDDQEVNNDDALFGMDQEIVDDVTVDYELDDDMDLDVGFENEEQADQHEDQFGDLYDDRIDEQNGEVDRRDYEFEAQFSDDEFSLRQFRDIVQEDQALNHVYYRTDKSGRYVERVDDRGLTLHVRGSLSSINNSLCYDEEGRKPVLERYISVEEEQEDCEWEEESKDGDKVDSEGEEEEEGEAEDEEDEGVFEDKDVLLKRTLGRIVEATVEAVVHFGDDGDNQDLDLLRDKVHGLCFEAVEAGNNQLGEDQAVAWADGFEVPPEVVEQDEERFNKTGYVFEQFVADKVKEQAHNRLSEERVDKWVKKDNKDYELLKELARVGIDLCLPSDYVPNSETGLPPYSRSYKKTHAAVDKMIYQNFYEKGLAIIITEALAKEKLGDFSVAVARWAAKAGKVWGRNIHDATAAIRDQVHILNSRYSKAQCKEKYGAIHCPTLQDIICMVFEFWERERASNPKLRWDEVILWKMDLCGAFTLLNFAVRMVRHVGLRLWGGLIVFFLCGVFGWTGTPGCFQVINRVLMSEAALTLYGLAKMFVDDVMGVTLRSKVLADQQIMRELITGLLGEGAVAEDKTESGRRIVILGFLIDLDKRLATISHRNLVKALYSFMTVDEHGLVSFKELERMASLGSRYGLVCVHMNPMVRLLYKELHKHRWSRRPVFKVDNDTKVAIWFFRAMLVATGVSEEQYCRPLHSFRQIVSYISIGEFDACPTGIGCIWYTVKPSGENVAVGAASWDITPMEFGTDSAFQNTCEFMGAIMALVGIVRYGLQDKPFILRGDSKSALGWAEKRRYRGDRVVPAGVLFNYVWMEYQAMLGGTVHVPAERNKACDHLSRQYVGDVPAFRKNAERDLKKRVKEYQGIDHTMVGDRSACVEIELFMEICNPRQNWETEEDLSIFWKKVKRWCYRVLGDKPPPWQPSDV